MLRLIGCIVAITLLISGCASKEQVNYYNAIDKQNEAYMKAYQTVENESVVFNGTFNGEIKIIKPKELPKLANIAQPRSGSEIALDWAKVLVPGVATVAGMHYGFKAIQSGNDASVANTKSYTGNYKNNTNDVSNVNTSNSIDKSITTSTDNTSVDKSITDTATTSTTQTTVPVTVDGTTTTVGP